VPFAGELLAMVVIGGMRSMLGTRARRAVLHLFRELFSIWTPNWLLCLGLIFVSFVIYSLGWPGRHLGTCLRGAGGPRRKNRLP